MPLLRPTGYAERERGSMTADIIAARSIERARKQDVRARCIGAGRYQVKSKSGPGWYNQTAERVGGHVIVICDCPGGQAFKDDFGSSLCKHSVATSKRLLRLPAELARVPRPEAPKRISRADIGAIFASL